MMINFPYRSNSKIYEKKLNITTHFASRLDLYQGSIIEVLF